MQLDLTTLLIVSGLVTVVCGVSFIANTAMQRNDLVGRLWSVAFMMGMLTTLSYGLWGMRPESWWIVAIGNGAYVLAVGSVWSGARVFNDRPSIYWSVIFAALLVTLVSFLTGSFDNLWFGSCVLFLAIAFFAALGVVENFRARLRRNLNARMLAVILCVLSSFYVARSAALTVAPAEDPLLQRVFGTTQSALVLIIFLLLGSISLSVLQAERSGSQALGDRTVGSFSAVGLLSAHAFTQQWQDWLDRAATRKEQLAMVAVDVDALPQMNVALGRDFGDSTIATVAQLLRKNAPTASLIGHPGAGRFVVVLAADKKNEAEDLARKLHSVLVDHPVDVSRGLRATVSCGVVHTDTHGYDLQVLSTALAEATVSARTAGGNRSVVAPPRH